jgi:hypothetical protein
MPPPPATGKSQVGFVGCLAALGLLALMSLGAWLVTQWIPDNIGRHLGRPYAVLYYLSLVLAAALIQVRRYHKRGQTIREGLRADWARYRRQREIRRDARQAPAVLPWLTSPGQDPADWPGVTPAPEGYHAGYDVVLDAAGDNETRVANQVRRLTRLQMAAARQLVNDAPVVVLRVPDAAMAAAAKAFLEYAGATVSVAEPTR